MSTLFAERLWPACFSALHLDRFLLGELDPPAADEVRAHLASCTRCSEAVQSMRAREPLPPLRVVPLRPRSRRVRVVAAAAGLAAAASVLLLLRPPAPRERSKGPGFSLGMYVQHGGEVRRAGPSETVAPGDAVRFTVTAPAGGYVAVLSLDPQGRGSIYYPAGPRAAPVSAGSDLALPLGTRLDASVGEERIVGLFCASPVELEPLRASLERPPLAVPEGCQVTRWSFVKR
ncbi:MAG TPA: zf-HC2 domain-containing protein [Myxococcales bacterium]|nr:zf-HC2 domain-containing protein [Myxococcales bacterium]